MLLNGFFVANTQFPFTKTYLATSCTNTFPQPVENHSITDFH